MLQGMELPDEFKAGKEDEEMEMVEVERANDAEGGLRGGEGRGGGGAATCRAMHRTAFSSTQY